MRAHEITARKYVHVWGRYPGMRPDTCQHSVKGWRGMNTSGLQLNRAEGLPNILSVHLNRSRHHRKRQLPLGALRTHELRLPSRKPKKKRERKRRNSGEQALDRHSHAAPPKLFAAPAAALGLWPLPSGLALGPAARRLLPAGRDLRCVPRPRRH